jgi:hypothetical protein
LQILSATQSSHWKVSFAPIHSVRWGFHGWQPLLNGCHLFVQYPPGIWRGKWMKMKLGPIDLG